MTARPDMGAAAGRAGTSLPPRQARPAAEGAYRVPASAQTPAGARSRTPAVGGTAQQCRECGGDFEARRATREFCSSSCRDVHKNRRKIRGAQLYDLYMAHRHDRAEAERLGVFTTMNRLAAHWHAEDEARRAGFKSWRPLRAVLAELRWLAAERLVQRRRR